MNDPLITVVTPYYNNAKTIRDALDSVLSQSYDNIQIILVDDGSSDFDSDAITEHVERTKKSNVVDFLILRSEQNLGTVRAWNLALPHVKGEYVFSLAADDCFYDENVLADCVREFLSTGALVLTAKRAVFDPTLRSLRYYAPSSNEIDAIRTCSDQQLIDRLAGGNFIFGCCTAFHKNSYEIIGGKLDERYRLVEDYPMVLKLLRANVKFFFFNRIVIKYRLGGISNACNIDKRYLKEADELFYEECYPYVSDQRAAKTQYKKWKNRVAIAGDRKKYRIRFHSDTDKIGRLLYRITMILRHPAYMWRKFREKYHNKNAHQ